MPVVTIATFAQLVTRAAQEMPQARHDALEVAGRRLQHRARGYLGRYQGPVAPFPAWWLLSPRTIADKIVKGYAVPSPLLRTGEMRATIGYHVGRNYVDVGSEDQVAYWQEFGTSRSGSHPGIPPRPFLGRAVAAIGPAEVRRIGRAMLGPLWNGGRP